ncbi:hypothetical protein T458_26830 [Brevibacillus panacihumi W25]|uniref:Uncharacterized protein n=1 Tax=Brevibacillus panacihumi W25 TaxID=1408254 RepID=V6M0L5_9BACL|nr:hypothetical protein T458_26830 [Brevibacillus panacihumi W25]
MINSFSYTFVYQPINKPRKGTLWKHKKVSIVSLQEEFLVKMLSVRYSLTRERVERVQKNVQI